jgi:hypothetical protein
LLGCRAAQTLFKSKGSMAGINDDGLDHRVRANGRLKLDCGGASFKTTTIYSMMLPLRHQRVYSTICFDAPGIEYLDRGV